MGTHKFVAKLRLNLTSLKIDASDVDCLPIFDWPQSVPSQPQQSNHVNQSLYLLQLMHVGIAAVPQLASNNNDNVNSVDFQILFKLQPSIIMMPISIVAQLRSLTQSQSMAQIQPDAMIKDYTESSSKAWSNRHRLDQAQPHRQIASTSATTSLHLAVT
jgi:hypothetical protein